MRIITASTGKQSLKISRTEWEKIGQSQGWMVEAKKKGKKPSAKFERCVMHVKEKAEKKDGEYDPNPWAVCHHSVDKK